MPGKSAAEVADVRRRDEVGASVGTNGIRVLRDVEELASVREDWLRLLTDRVVADPDFYEATLRADPRIVRPHVLVLEEEGEVRAMLIGRVEKLDFAVRMGYRKLYAPGVHSITIVEDGILGDVDEETFRRLVATLRASLQAEGADVAIFRYLPLDSPLYAVASAELPFLGRQHVRDSELRWELALPESVDDILRALSSSTRQTVKRYSKKLEREYENRISVRTFTEPAELEDFFRDVEPVSAKTYLRALGVSFGDNAKDRERTRVSMEHGWFRGYVLYIDGEPRAFHHGELYRGRFRLGRPGYDPELAHLRLGTYLLLHVLDDLVQHPEARFVDYGIGDADYKRRFGTRGWREGNVIVYAPTMRAARINIVRTVLLSGVGLAKRILGKGETYKRIRRDWRRRMTRTPAA
jgi:CelD/BcsL family acetyltransferase involved in cellulose biosynthesis